MKKNKIHTLLLLTVIAMLNCVGIKNTEKGSTLIVQSSDIKSEIIDTIYFKKSHIIPLETNNNSLFRKITRICYDENKLFILDKSLNKIIIFDITGKFITSIQNVGQAEGECTSVMDFCIETNKKQIFLLCDRPYKIIKFDYSGKFIKEKKLDELYFNITTDSNYIYCNKLEIGSNANSEYEIDCYSLDFENKHTYLSLRDDIKSQVYSPGNQLTSTLNNYYSRRFDNSIYQLNTKNAINKYTIDFANNSIPESILTTTNQEDLMKLVREKNWVYSITDIVESKNFLMFKTNIALYVYNKNSNELNGFKTIANSTLKLNNNSFYPLNNSNKIASIISPSVLSSVKKIAKARKEFDNFELLKLAEKVKDEDNPILILYEFKD